MPYEEETGPWRGQSSVTDPGRFGVSLDSIPADVRAIRSISQNLVAHYNGNADGSMGPVTGDRLREVDTRYAEPMFMKLLASNAGEIRGSRAVDERVVGCCRDFAVLFVSIARHKGIPARVRVGYADYFQKGWYLDHVIAEVFLEKEGRWRLVESEISDSYASTLDFDPTDIPRNRFITGPEAWKAARAGAMDHARFVVSPDLQVPYTRSWLSLRHHIIQDLASMCRAEMILWDQWGLLNDDDPLSGAATLDRMAAETASADVSAETLRKWVNQAGIAPTPVVTSYSPARNNEPVSVDVSRSLQRMIR